VERAKRVELRTFAVLTRHERAGLREVLRKSLSRFEARPRP
jgi:hypothetical protein